MQSPVLLPGKSHGWRSLVGFSPRGREESDTTERLHFYFSLSCIGEGNGNPLQCSCLENPRDSRAWWAAVYGVTQSQTRLMRLISSISLYEIKHDLCIIKHVSSWENSVIFVSWRLQKRPIFYKGQSSSLQFMPTVIVLVYNPHVGQWKAVFLSWVPQTFSMVGSFISFSFSLKVISSVRSFFDDSIWSSLSQLVSIILSYSLTS